MKNYFLIHGTFGDPNENWFPWLADKLRQNGANVIIPRFPTPEGQAYENWERILKKDRALINERTVFFAHSSGCPFIIDYIVKNKVAVDGLLCVSGFYDFFIGDETFDRLNKEFYFDDLDISEIKELSRFIYCVYSNNDPYLPREQLVAFSKKVATESEEIKNGGHFNKDSGFLEFPQLINALKKYQ